MWTKVARFILKNRIAVLLMIAGITVFMAFQARKIEMSYQYAPLLPEDDPAYIEYQEFVEMFGNEGNMIVIGVQDRHFFQLNAFKEWQRLASELKAVEGVTSVFSVAQSYDLKKNAEQRKFEVIPIFHDSLRFQTELDSMKRHFCSLPFYRGMLYNQESDAYLMAITLDPSILQSARRVALIDQIKKVGLDYQTRTGTQVHYSGLPYIRVVTAEMVKQELNMFVILAGIITMVIMFVFFRSLRTVLLSMLVVSISVVWALGIQGLFGYKITILTGMIPPLLIVIGIPNVIFILNKYHNEYRRHNNKIKSIQRVIRKIGNASFLTNLTTALGFGTFVFTSSKILVEFGVIASINIMCVYLICLLVIPILFSYMPAPSAKKLEHLDNKMMGRVVNVLNRINQHHRRPVYIFTIALLVFGLIGITKMKTTGYMLDDIPHEDPLYLDLKFFEKNFDGLMPVEIMVDTQKPNGVFQVGNMTKLDQLQSEISAMPEFSQALSLVEAVKFARQSFYNGNEARYGIPNNQERGFILSYVGKSQGGQAKLINTFVDSLKQRTRLSFRMADVGTTHMRELEQQVQAAIDSTFPGDKYFTRLTGASIIFFKGTDYLITNLFSSLALAIFLISLFMAWMFKSKRMVLVSLIPNMVPLIMTAGLMGYFGIPIKPSTILVFSIAFGISVDDAIHYLSKYRLDLKETNWSIRAAVFLALKETGVSMIYTSIILFFGFGIFSVSQFGGTQALGMLIAITLLVAMFSNLILLPSLLMSLDKMITTRSFKEPLLQIYNEDEDIELDSLRIPEKELAEQNIEKP
ncbi:MAG: MMPL family transporter [Breznakibacter sp.]|nr:MMPL family transporter [Breznakibacter sp.]